MIIIKNIYSQQIQIKRKIIKKIYALFLIFILSILNININIENAIKNPLFKIIRKKFDDEHFINKNNIKCDKLDPIYIMGQRFKKPSIQICKSKNTEHICFQSSKYDYSNQLYYFKNGIICLMKNIILNPLNSSQTSIVYKGPNDKYTRGAPILFPGFFNIQCKLKNKCKKCNKIYRYYLNSWNYYENTKNTELEELAPGKIIFFISRNQDSPNLFHGFSEIMNALSIMYLFNLQPKDIQIVFLESMIFKNEPYMDFYTNIISRGNKPIYIRNLKKLYHISSAFHIPISADSPLYARLKAPSCLYSTKSYSLINNLLNKYLNLNIYKDSFFSDNNTFYYPELIIKSHKSNIFFKKIITIQWRRVWPRGRINQERILGNGPELSEALSLVLPKNYLIRLIDTASLPMTEQISIIRTTDYLIGVHGAGLTLSIFMPENSIYHEIRHCKRNDLLLNIAKLSGHKSFADIIKNEIKYIDSNEYIFFEKEEFIKCVLKRMKQINFFNY